MEERKYTVAEEALIAYLRKSYGDWPNRISTRFSKMKNEGASKMKFYTIPTLRGNVIALAFIAVLYLFVSAIESGVIWP